MHKSHQIHECRNTSTQWKRMGWLRLVGSLKLYVSLKNIGLFCRALLQKRPMILRSLLIVATPYLWKADPLPLHTHTHTRTPPHSHTHTHTPSLTHFSLPFSLLSHVRETWKRKSERNSHCLCTHTHTHAHPLTHTLTHFSWHFSLVSRSSVKGGTSHLQESCHILTSHVTY